jgi:CTP:molybdopterin cytidylyltransferase MocA
LQAIILAGGEGLRLRPLTFTIPKPLMPVGEEPIMQRLIERLRASGVKEIGVATGYGFDLVEAYFKDGARLGVQLHYVREVAKLGTAGPLAAFADWARGPVIIVNGDILTLQDLRGAPQLPRHVGSGDDGGCALMGTPCPLRRDRHGPRSGHRGAREAVGTPAHQRRPLRDEPERAGRAPEKDST